MLLRIRRVSALRTQAFYRALSTHQLYPDKVYAYPFKISTAEAILQLGPYASIFHGGAGLAISAAAARFLPFLGFRPPQPLKIVPVYFPAWIIDAEVAASVSASTDRGKVKGDVSCVFLNSYLPGHTMEKLSSISLLSHELSSAEAVPFSADLDTQHGAKITCLPFTTSPFSLLDSAKSLSDSALDINQQLHIDPQSITTNLMCAYPVLVPVYLAQYPLQTLETTEAASFTIILEAHCSYGRIMIEDVSDWIKSALEGLSPMYEQYMKLGVELGRYDETFLYSPRGGVAPFANISTTTLPAAWNIEGFEYFSVWLNNNFTSRGGAQKLATNEADREMKDPRIRPFTVAEVKHVRDFFALGEECSKAQAIRDGLSKVSENGMEGKTRKEVEKYSASLEAKRQKALPGWWKDWLSQQNN
ncbi:hypothetical protein C8J57DRAFT_1289983 [Mycena rebaudengoi]|nr:hypothetical protein C8J57DRAFT_1289983 [Mycena rebaudengoi]